MFDGLALDLSYHLHPFENKLLEAAHSEIDYLSNEGLLTTLNGLQAQYGQDYYPGHNTSSTIEGSIWIGESLTHEINTWNRAIRGVGKNSQLHEVQQETGRLRYTASKLRLEHGIDAVAVPTDNEPYDIDSKAERETVIKITLYNFPTPSDETPWENIIDFRKDKIANEQYLRLKNWMNDITKKEMKSFEITDQLQSLLAAYEHEMKVRDMATKRNTLQVIVQTTGEMIQHLSRLKFGDAIKALFDISKHKLHLLEEEKKAEGREIAYIYTANRKFAT